MSDTNCPFCGEPEETDTPSGITIYRCGTRIYPNNSSVKTLICDLGKDLRREREAHNNTKRERDEARDLLASEKITRDHVIKRGIEMQKERDEARKVASGLAIQEERVNEAQKELSSIHQWIERNHPDGFIDSLTYFQNLERVTENWYDRLDRLEVDAKRFERERDEAREQNAKLRDIAERLFAAGVGRMKTDDWRTLRAELDKIKEGAK